MIDTRLTALALIALLPLGAAAQDSREDYLSQFDTNGDGRVSSAEYVVYMSAGFKLMDSNGDGTLEPAELPGGRGKVVTLAGHQSNLRRQFQRLDRNRDGYLNAGELTAPPG